jgi:hypothetical protein
MRPGHRRGCACQKARAQKDDRVADRVAPRGARAELRYLGDIPENLQGGERYEQAEHCVEALDDAIEQLDGAF